MEPGTKTFTVDLIAPCGLNCRLCRAYGRKKNPCPGCRGDDASKPKARVVCRIKTCDRIAAGEILYCFECEEYPCKALEHLDKRYRTTYFVSVIENLESIRGLGIERFLEKEIKSWSCRGCGGILCMHRETCDSCGHRRR